MSLFWFNIKLLLCYLPTVVGNNEIGDDKNEGKSLAIWIAMQMRRYDPGHITR